MNIAVCVKRVGKIDDDIEFTGDHDNVDPDYLDYALNEWDAAATAEALRLREESGPGEVTVVTVGDAEADEVLVQCLAMGADRAIRVDVDVETVLDPLTVGRLLAKALQPVGADLVLCGAQSADSAQGATGSVVAAMLGYPCATVVTKIETSGDGASVAVQRELEGGVLDLVRIACPSVLTIQTGIAEPRYVTLRALQAAQQQTIEVLDADASVLAAPGYRVRRMEQPTTERAELINGGAAAVAARIMDLVREVSR